MTARRVVVTGVGTINPLGNTIQEYFSNLEKGVSGAAPITHFDTEKFKTKFACEVKNYDPSQYFDRKEVRKYDLFTQYALIAATQAVEDAGFDMEKLDKEQAGVIWSSGIGGLKSFFDECTGYAEGGNTPRFSPFFIPRMIADIAAGYISIKYGFMGLRFVEPRHDRRLQPDPLGQGRRDGHGRFGGFGQRTGRGRILVDAGHLDP